MAEVNKHLGNAVTYSTDPYDALRDADAMVLMTEWSEFHLPDFSRMADIMKGRVIFDGRNIYDPQVIKKMGFTYYGIGRR
jgi:UDPglucose 6-dehydrogenase